MPESTFFNMNTLMAFLLVMVRITGMIFSAPLFSQSGVPNQLQAGVAIILSLILFPVYASHAVVPAHTLWMLAWLAGQELVIGLLIGFTANMLFAATEMAGNYVTTQMGLGIAHALDPISNEQLPLLGQFFFILALTLFLSLDLHHALILAVAKSLEAIPIATGLTHPNLLVGKMMSMAGSLFEVSMMLILPLFGILLVLEIALALLSKLMPQMNVFMVAIPLKVVTGLTLLYLTLPFTQEALSRSCQVLAEHLLTLYRF